MRYLLRTSLSVPTAQFYCFNSHYDGHQSASFDILVELSQIVIYFFLSFSSSLSLWLKSAESRLTWSSYETIVLTCKKQHDVLDVHKLDFLVPWFIAFLYYKFFSKCCGEWEGDASFVLLRFVMFLNKVLTLFICENCTAICSGDNVHNK